jgi:hypothetical protein
VAEGARLESVFTRKGNVGSNPTLSAITLVGQHLRHGDTYTDTKPQDACKRRFNAILVWKANRFGRSLTQVSCSIARTSKATLHPQPQMWCLPSLYFASNQAYVQHQKFRLDSAWVYT